MFTYIFFDLKNWWFGETVDRYEEFELVESKHTRVHYDEDIYEVIRVH